MTGKPPPASRSGNVSRYQRGGAARCRALSYLNLQNYLTHISGPVCSDPAPPRQAALWDALRRPDARA